MDRSVCSPQTRSVVGVRGPGVSVFGLPVRQRLHKPLLGLKFKLSDEHSLPLHMRAPPGFQMSNGK